MYLHVFRIAFKYIEIYYIFLLAKFPKWPSYPFNVYAHTIMGTKSSPASSPLLPPVTLFARSLPCKIMVNNFALEINMISGIEHVFS